VVLGVVLVVIVLGVVDSDCGFSVVVVVVVVVVGLVDSSAPRPVSFAPSLAVSF